MKLVIFLLVVIGLLAGLVGWRAFEANDQVSAPVATTPKRVAPVKTQCTDNELAKNVIVSVGRRHLWACAGRNMEYDSPVVTGQQKIAADLTPVGTYHIWKKQTERWLTGSDSTGHWSDYVHYWMPWLHNQYGNYGFHDATWRKDSDFGSISPYSDRASHGCVELPLAAAKWLYEWAPVGTTVTIRA